MIDVVVAVRVMTLPVMTSVIVIRYSVMTPLISFIGGGAHDSETEVELAGRSVTFWGELDGAENVHTQKNITYFLITSVSRLDCYSILIVIC